MMGAVVRRGAAAVVVAMTLLATGCGKGGDRASTPPAKGAPSTPTAPSTQTAPRPPSSPRPPVPKPSAGKVDAASAQVIKDWLAALRAGDLQRAADFFAQPSKVSNATPVLTLRTRRDRVGFMATFPCGATATKLGAGERGFVLVTYALTERKGGDCMGAAGNPAYGAIRVSGGHIVEWYRLPDDPGGAAPSPLGDGSGGGQAV